MGRDLASMSASRAAAGCRRSTEPRSSHTWPISNWWQVVDDHHLEKEFQFPDFKQALAYTNRVGELAEEIGLRTSTWRGGRSG